ncbi:MAG: shikimate kinase [Lentisphaeraceae bacterium]|nr:shikimate kinase [Lentisphaeraceae bacterium]
MSYFGKTNVVMVGMPGAGKSTIGLLLAKDMSLNFMDVDVFIQGHEGRQLQDIIDNDGIETFKKLEEKYLMDIDVCSYIISTGGSAIYCKNGIEHLKQTSVVVYLNINLETLKERIGDFSTRGVVIKEGQTFMGLYEERCHLYAAAADVEIDCNGKSMEEIVGEIRKALGR